MLPSDCYAPLSGATGYTPSSPQNLAEASIKRHPHIQPSHFSPLFSSSLILRLLPSPNLLSNHGLFQLVLTGSTDELMHCSQTSETSPTSCCCASCRIWMAVHYSPSPNHAKTLIVDCSPASGNTTSDFRTAICCTWPSNTTTLALRMLCSSTTPTSMHFTEAKLL